MSTRRVCFVSAAPGRRVMFLSLLSEHLKRLGFDDVDVVHSSFENFSLDQKGKQPTALVVFDLVPEGPTAKHLFQKLKECKGEKPLLLCTYSAESTNMADCAVEHGGAKACLAVAESKLGDRETVLRFLGQHLIGLPNLVCVDDEPEETEVPAAPRRELVHV